MRSSLATRIVSCALPAVSVLGACGGLVGIGNVQLDARDASAPSSGDGGQPTPSSDGGPATPRDSAAEATVSGFDGSADAGAPEAGGTDAGGCLHASNGAACDDGNPCTYADTCAGGACVGTSVTCPPSTPCATFACNGTSTCTEAKSPDQKACGPSSADVCFNGVCGCGFPGLLAYFTFEGDTDDSSGNANDATATGVSYVSGKLGSSAVSVGAGGSIALSGATNAGFTFTGGGGDAAAIVSRTLCAWLQPPASAGAAALPVFTAGNPYASNASGFNPADLFALQSPNPSNGCPASALNAFIDRWGQGACLTEAVTVPSGTWGQVCFIETENGYTLAVNGSVQSGGFVPAGTPYTWTLGSIVIGSNPYTASTTTGTAFLGALDEVSIWDRALTASELSALYNGGSGCACR
jgi:hypothetical protein